MKTRIKRAYDNAAREDGRRILVDRLWPRGLSKSDLRLDSWMREIAPSAGLRQWFGHDPKKWAEFKRRYFAELDEQAEAAEQLLAGSGSKAITLIYGAKDEQHNNAVALKEYLLRNRRGRGQNGVSAD